LFECRGEADEVEYKEEVDVATLHLNKLLWKKTQNYKIRIASIEQKLSVRIQLWYTF